MRMEDVLGFGLIALGAGSVAALVGLMIRALFRDRSVRVFGAYCLLLISLACGLLLLWAAAIGLLPLIITSGQNDWVVLAGVVGLGLVSLAGGLLLIRGGASGGT